MSKSYVSKVLVFKIFFSQIRSCSNLGMDLRLTLVNFINLLQD
jgi:hypothetical protein